MFGKVEFEAVWCISPPGSKYRRDSQELRWDSGPELLRVDDEDGEINLWRLADLLLEDGFSLEE